MTKTMNTTIDSITFTPNGIAEVRLKKRPIDPTNEDEMVRGWHRLTLEPGACLDNVFTPVNDSLNSIGVLPIDADSWARLTALCAAAWTEEVVAAFKAQSQQHNQ